MPLLNKPVRVKKNGLAATLNWHDRGFCGITYTEGDLKGISALLDEEDVELPPDEPKTRIDLSSLSYEELREFLIAIRSARRSPPPKKVEARATDDDDDADADADANADANANVEEKPRKRGRKPKKLPDVDQMLQVLKGLPPEKAKAIVEAAMQRSTYGGAE